MRRVHARVLHLDAHALAPVAHHVGGVIAALVKAHHSEYKCAFEISHERHKILQHFDERLRARAVDRVREAKIAFTIDCIVAVTSAANGRCLKWSDHVPGDALQNLARRLPVILWVVPLHLGRFKFADRVRQCAVELQTRELARFAQPRDVGTAESHVPAEQVWQSVAHPVCSTRELALKVCLVLRANRRHVHQPVVVLKLEPDVQTLHGVIETSAVRHHKPTGLLHLCP